MAASHQQTHQAGRHLVLAEALIRGLPARLVGVQSYVTVNEVKAQVQVAAKGAWMIEDVYRYTQATIGHVILVNMSRGAREIYICPGETLREEVLKRHEQFLAGHGGTRPRNPTSKHSAIKPEDVAKWRDKWASFS